MRLVRTATGAVLVAVLALVLVAPPAPAAEPQLVLLCQGDLRTVTSPGILGRLGQRTAFWRYSLVADARSSSLSLIVYESWGGDGWPLDVAGRTVEHDRDGGELWVYRASGTRPYTVTYRRASESVTIDYPGRNVKYDVHGSFSCPAFESFFGDPALRRIPSILTRGGAGTDSPAPTAWGGGTAPDGGQPAWPDALQGSAAGQAPADGLARRAQAGSTEARGGWWPHWTGGWWTGTATPTLPQPAADHASPTWSRGRG